MAVLAGHLRGDLRPSSDVLVGPYGYAAKDASDRKRVHRSGSERAVAGSWKGAPSLAGGHHARALLARREDPARPGGGGAPARLTQSAQVSRCNAAACLASARCGEARRAGAALAAEGRLRAARSFAAALAGLPRSEAGGARSVGVFGRSGGRAARAGRRRRLLDGCVSHLEGRPARTAALLRAAGRSSPARKACTTSARNAATPLPAQSAADASFCFQRTPRPATARVPSLGLPKDSNGRASPAAQACLRPLRRRRLRLSGAERQGVRRRLRL